MQKAATPHVNSVEQDIALLEAADLFDGEWYLHRYADVGQLGLGASEHFVRLGAMLLRDPGPRFCSARYIEANPDVAASAENPLLHYLRTGKAEGRLIYPVPGQNRSAADAVLDSDIRTIRSTVLFDAGYYLRAYPDVAKHGMDPLLHYVKYGAREGRQPNPFFSSRLYRDTCQPAGDATNPLVHYITAPGSDRARTSVLFDGNFYASRYEDVGQSGAKPLEHYLAIGLAEGRQATFATAAQVGVPRIVDCRRTRATIVVPVHDAFDETLDCVHSILRHTELGGADSLLILDDASTDPRVRAMLEHFEGLAGITVVRNAENLGYTQTVNNGCMLAGADDVILLNSDTVVSAHWLRNLKVAAYRNDRTGTVTAVSNNAGAFSVPDPGTNTLPAGFDIDAVARSMVDGTPHLPFEVPTGNGFCLYIKRALIDEIGLFDEVNFPVGYGEENDFCMRAMAAGWANMVDPATYVGHVRTASFGERKQQLAAAGLKRMQEMWPEYAGAIRAMGVSAHFAATRSRIERQLRSHVEAGRAPRPRVMYVISTRIGGTPQTNADLMHAVADVYDCYALYCNRNVIEVLEAHGTDYNVLQSYPLTEAVRFATHLSSEYDAIVRSILVDWRIDLLHVRHLAWHSLNLIDVAASLGVPVIRSFHDFYAICPTVHLVGGDGVYVPTGVVEHALNPLWRKDISATAMTRAYLQRWQDRMQKTLGGCDAFVTTSQSARTILTNALPELAARAADTHVIPHGRDFERHSQLADPGEIGDGEPMRILLPGNIGLQKGLELVRQVKDLDIGHLLEFHVLGQCGPGLAGRVVNHGAYQREEFADRVASIRPHVAAVLSIWPETWCHTLTESWSCGVPVVGIDLGAVGERIRRHGGGWLVGAPASAEALYELLLRIRASAAERQGKVREVERWQQGAGRQNTTARMAGQYLSVYRAVMERRRLLARSGVKRTALVLRQWGAALSIEETGGLERCRKWLQRKFGQPVDVIGWNALLRAERAAYSAVVIQAGAASTAHSDDVVAWLAHLGESSVFELTSPSVADFPSAGDPTNDQLRLYTFPLAGT